MSLTPWDSEVLCEQKGSDFYMEMGGFTLRMKTHVSHLYLERLWLALSHFSPPLHKWTVKAVLSPFIEASSRSE